MSNIPVFGRRASEIETFPTVVSLEIVANQDSCGYLDADYLISQRYDLTEIPRIIVCANERCKRGGFGVQNVLRRMVETQRTEDKFVLNCLGDEGSPEGRRIGKRCMNDCEIAIKIVYKTGSNESFSGIGKP